jgi:hypothetical protein
VSDTPVNEEFLDTYEGEVLFLSQDLDEVIDAMQDGSFNEENMQILEQKLLDVSDVFLSSSYTQHVAPMFREFATYLSLIDFHDFTQYSDVKSYLTNIIIDINAYINLYFVERSFSDVYLFQDSLKNSIAFLERAYKCDLGEVMEEEDDGSELDFF